MIQKMMTEQLSVIEKKMGASNYKASQFPTAAKYLSETILGEAYSDFLTTLAYPHLLESKTSKL